MAEITTELYDAEQIPAPDDLVAGSAFITCAPLTITGTGEYHRGEILVKSGDSFVKGSKDSLAGASEIGICTADFELEEDSEMKLACYVMGHFSMRRIYLGGELLSTLTGQEQIAVQDSLRQHKIFLH